MYCFMSDQLNEGPDLQLVSKIVKLLYNTLYVGLDRLKTSERQHVSYGTTH